MTIRSNAIRKFAAVTVAATAVVALAASASTSEQAQTTGGGQQNPPATQPSGSGSGSQAPSTTAAPTAKTYSVGETGAAGDWKLTVNGVQDPWVSPESFDTPDGRYVALDVTVEYSGSDPSTVSSLLCFELQDSSGRQGQDAIVIGGESTIGGSIDPGGKQRGMLYYDVRADATGLVLRFDCDLLADNAIKFNV